MAVLAATLVQDQALIEAITPRDVGPIDIVYLSFRDRVTSTGEHQPQSARSRLIVDGDRLYFMERLTRGATLDQVAGREYLFDGESLYLSNSLGITKVYPVDAVYPYAAPFFSSVYAEAIGYDLPNEASEVGKSAESLEEAIRCAGVVDLETAGADLVQLLRRSGTALERVQLSARDGATIVHSVETWTEAGLARRCTNHDHVRIGESWIPRWVTCESFDPAQQNEGPVSIEEIVLDGAEPHARAFPTRPSLMTPGTQVVDARRSDAPTAMDGALSYIEPMPIDALEAAWRAGVRARRAPRRSSLFGVLAGMVASAVLLARRRA